MTFTRWTSIGLALLLVSGVHAHSFEPLSVRKVARCIGIGTGPGYHVFPCQPKQARYWNSYVTGQPNPRACFMHQLQTPKVPPAMPVRLGSMPAYTGCGCQYKPTSYTFTGMSGSAPMPIEHSVAPRTLDGTIEALPKLNAKPQDEPTRAPLLPSPGPVGRGVETDAQLFQYDPDPEMREPAPKLPPGFRQDDEDAVEDRKLQLQEKLDPSAFESLEAPTTGLADQW